MYSLKVNCKVRQNFEGQKRVVSWINCTNLMCERFYSTVLEIALKILEISIPALVHNTKSSHCWKSAINQLKSSIWLVIHELFFHACKFIYQLLNSFKFSKTQVSLYFQGLLQHPPPPPPRISLDRRCKRNLSFWYLAIYAYLPSTVLLVLVHYGVILWLRKEIWSWEFEECLRCFALVWLMGQFVRTANFISYLFLSCCLKRVFLTYTYFRSICLNISLPFVVLLLSI